MRPARSALISHPTLHHLPNLKRRRAVTVEEESITADITVSQIIYDDILAIIRSASGMLPKSIVVVDHGTPSRDVNAGKTAHSHTIVCLLTHTHTHTHMPYHASAGDHSASDPGVAQQRVPRQQRGRQECIDAAQGGSILFDFPGRCISQCYWVGCRARSSTSTSRCWSEHSPVRHTHPQISRLMAVHHSLSLSLSFSLAACDGSDSGVCVVALCFLLPGRHAGRDGDISQILEKASLSLSLRTAG